MTVIVYTDSPSGLSPESLQGFFVGWPDPPSPETHLNILRGSAAVVLAVDDETQQAVGFINAISDGCHAAFIPNLEVLPEYQGQGIGSELVRHLLDKLSGYYAIDLVCDPPLQAFYERLG
nr:GNAT family N-acetyltransferase [Anaerolineae bacterium]